MNMKSPKICLVMQELTVPIHMRNKKQNKVTLSDAAQHISHVFTTHTSNILVLIVDECSTFGMLIKLSHTIKVNDDHSDTHNRIDFENS